MLNTALHGGSNVEARAKTMYNKASGVLTLTNTRILWVPDGQTKPTVSISHSKISNLFCSKEGLPKKKMKLNVSDREEPYMFHFTSPPQIAENELATFKRLLLEVITQNTSKAAVPLPEHSISTAATPFSINSPASMSRASPAPPYSRSSSAGPSKGQPFGFEIYQKVLTKNPELASLHRELVVSGQITEAEFWEGREYLLAAEATSASQRKGKSSEIVVPRLKTGEQGQIMLTLTPQLLTDIFEEFPIVLQAYHDSVPKKLKEGEFWERYFSSKLFDRHRASSRNSVAKPDAIFDRYLEREDDEIEPLHPRNERVQLLLDLSATEEDHGETGNGRDMSMQAGKRKNAIPVIRRFNEHSERLLQSALGDTPPKRRRLDGPEALLPEPLDDYSQIELDDLHIRDNSPGISLQLQNTQRFLDGLGGEAGGKRAPNPGLETIPDLPGVLNTMRSSLESWATDLSGLSMQQSSVEEAVQDMTTNVTSRLESRLRKDEIPPSITQQISTCATASNEFLRQFWSAILPPPVDGQVLSSSTPAQRTVRATKMVTYLSKTQEKVDAIIKMAVQDGVDRQVMETAFAPLMASVNKALETYQSQKR